jgi:hypothetical protein
VVESKTQWTGADVAEFLDAVPDETRRADGRTLCEMMQRVTGQAPRMWGPSIVGFGKYHYRYESGREGDAPLAGFSPRARELVVYLESDAPEKESLLERVGKHRTGKCCLYIKKLADTDLGVLEQLVVDSAKATKARYPD